jgi:hypothetical protein
VVLGDEDAAAYPEIAEVAAPALAPHRVDGDIQLGRDLLVGESAR